MHSHLLLTPRFVRAPREQICTEGFLQKQFEAAGWKGYESWASQRVEGIVASPPWPPLAPWALWPPSLDWLEPHWLARLCLLPGQVRVMQIVFVELSVDSAHI